MLPILLVMVMLKRPACGLFGTTALVPEVMIRGLGEGLPVERLVTITCTPVPVKVMAAS